MKEQEKRNSDKGRLVKELKEKLDWYTLYASEEEYDEKAVESILYLLESLEPLEKEAVVCSEDAWGRFQEMVRQRGGAETGRIEQAEKPVGLETGRPEQAGKPAGLETGRLGPGRESEERIGQAGKPAAKTGRPEQAGKPAGRPERHRGMSISGRQSAKESLEISEELGIMPADYAKRREMGGIALHYKYIVAAALVMLILSVVGSTRAGAGPNTGFFHWLSRDSTRTQMVTSPEELDADVITDVKGVSLHYDREDVPEWAEEWLDIDKEFEMPEGYEWTRFEIEEPRNFHKITSYYFDRTENKKMLLGMVMYDDKISFNTEGFVDYSYVDSYEIDQKEMYVYSRREEKGRKCYIIYFYEGNCQYFMQGHDNLDELKGLIKRYWFYVKNNLEKNEFFCNNLLSQAIYK